MNQDSEHLKLLAIFHYVVAGMAALVAGTRPVGLGIMAFAAFFIVAGWTFAAMVAFAGRSLQTRQRYTYCLVMAGIECIFMPVGTVLGVFTIIVLVRDSVKALFGRPMKGDAATPVADE